jgi:NAD+ diphosphatase
MRERPRAIPGLLGNSLLSARRTANRLLAWPLLRRLMTEYSTRVGGCQIGIRRNGFDKRGWAMLSCRSMNSTITFVSSMEPPPGPRQAALWFIMQGDRLVVRPGDKAEPIPRAADPCELGLAPLRALYLGRLEDGDAQTNCWAAEIAAEAVLPEGTVADGLRSVHPLLGDLLWGVAGRAAQIVTWDRSHAFCGQCGAPTEPAGHERARRCPNCGLVAYPRLSPAIIIAVVRRTETGRQILLARNHRFPSGRYSVLAGYVEPGESLEECAHREVGEEAGIRIKEMRYFGSQPWPFPNSLMIGFTAEYDGGEIRIEESELADAAWFAADALPDLPPRMTIARKLIDWFLSDPQGLGDPKGLP